MKKSGHNVEFLFLFHQKKRKGMHPVLMWTVVLVFIAVLMWLCWKPTKDKIYVLVLPCLHTLEELESSEWYGYLCDVYGTHQWSVEDLPVDMSTFQFLYFSKIPLSISIPRDLGKYRRCPQLENQLYADMPGPHNPPDSLYVYKHPPYTALFPHTWIEVAHCVDKHIQQTEEVGCWFYYLPGTGIYFNLGVTIAFQDHDDAALYFLDKRCPDTECSGKVFTAMFTEAKKRGYDSVQFLHHADMRCGNTAIEVVDVHGRGSDSCCGHPLSFRRGWKGKGSVCRCDSTASCLNCGEI